ncbi:uncharacterized protein [Amphiura filiformis]|uniref:uncharacterized protein n=1 Tax=Amphiura filiformis TaxID=82378 RepID=UPI003B21C5E6
MTIFIDGDFMPHKDQIHLPSTWTKRFVYNKMKTEHIDRGIPAKDIISEPHFRTIWRQQFPEYVISKVIFTCSQLAEKFRSANTAREHEEVSALKKQHDEQVRKERAAYHKMRERAQREHESYTVMIVDGMDQSKTNVPRMVKDKDLAPLSRVHVHLTGVLLYTDATEGKIPLIYTDIKEIPHDSNTTVNIILRTLEMYKEKLGRVLFLQLDNCFRENKNKFVLSLASMLVESNVFEEVIIHFLPVGHTHEDVDQMFSRISKALKEHTDIYTIEDMIPVIEGCFTPRIKVLEARQQFNFKEWIGNYLAGRFRNHSKPLWFRFKRREGIVRMHYKMWVDDKWLPEEKVGADGFTVEEDSKGLKLLQSIPDINNIPQWVIPSLCKLDIEVLKKDLPQAYGERMPRDRREWWQHFMENIESLTEQLKLIIDWITLVIIGKKCMGGDAMTWPLVELAGRITRMEPVWESSLQLENIREKIQQSCDTVHVQIGTQGAFHPREVQHVSNYEELQLEDLVVVKLEESQECQWEKPYIGTVLEIDSDEVKIQWMKASYNKAWKKWVDGVGKNIKPRVDTIPIHSIILFGFKLTRKERLPGQTILDIQKLYSNL